MHIEKIAGWLDVKGVVSTSLQWIYRRIRSDREVGRVQIPGRLDISERSAAVEDKSRMSDWDLDTITGAGQEGDIVSPVDRKSKSMCLRAAANKTKALVGNALASMPGPASERVLIVTFHNRKEFVGHPDLGNAVGAHMYFALPYNQWERRLNEHSNRLVRRYFGNGVSLYGIEPTEV